MSDNKARSSRSVVSRRVLLAVGGLVLLGEFAAGEGTGGLSRAARAPQGSAAPDGLNARAMVSASPSAQTIPACDRPRTVGPPVSGPQDGTVCDPAGGTRPAADQSHAPAPPANGQPMYYLPDGPKVIALTIDDGPSPQYTPQVLGLLRRYGITATFSMIGENVAAHRSLAREVASAGHMIVNHTWTHANLALLSPAAVADQMNRANDVIQAATGRHLGMFRAPYGAWSPMVLKRCQQMGLTPLDWSVDPRDWARPGVSAIVSDIMRNTRSGSIILEHDGGGNRAETVAALKIVLPRLLDAGYHFRTP